MKDAQATQLLHDAVAIPSVSGEEERLVRFLVRRARSLGLEAERDEVGNLVAELPAEDPRAPHLVLLGHVDTVPGTIPVRIEGQRLHGRGSVDAKGALLAFLVATARRIDRAGAAPLCVSVVGCVEEEVPSSRGARAVAERFRPDWLVVGEPSGWDRVTLGYKGHVAATLRFQRASGHGAHAGDGASERAVRGWFELQAAAEAWSAERTRLFDRLLPRLGGLASGSDGLVDWATLAVSLRLPPDLPPPAARDWLRSVLPDAELSASEGLPAWSGPRTSGLARELARSIAGAGGRPGFQVKTGTADLNLLAPRWGCEAVAYGPGDAALDHTPREALELEEFLRSVRVLEDLLDRVAARGAAAPALTALR